MLAAKYYLSLPLPEEPSRKEELQPAIEANYHACKAGEYDLAAHTIWKYNFHYLLDLWGNSRTLIEIYERLLPKDHYKDEPLLEDKQIHGAVLGNLGLTYSHLGEPRKAIEYLSESLAIGKAIEDPRIIRFCEKKLKELDGSENYVTSKDRPASKNFLQTIVSKLKAKK